MKWEGKRKFYEAQNTVSWCHFFGIVWNGLKKKTKANLYKGVTAFDKLRAFFVSNEIFLSLTEVEASGLLLGCVHGLIKILARSVQTKSNV